MKRQQKKFDQLNYVMVAHNENSNLITHSVLEWWSNGTKQEPHMVSETVENLAKAHAIIFAFLKDGTPIAAAAIFQARSKFNEPILFNENLVVELGSNYVEPAWRNRNIGRKLAIERIRFSYKQGWLPVSVTSNPAMQKIFESLGSYPMDNIEEYQILREKLCLCKIVTQECNLCPLKNRAAWLLANV